MKRIDTMSIRDILRHHHDLGLPRAEIAVAVSVSAGTVSNVLERAQAAGLSWPLPSDLDDDGLRAQLYPPVPRESGYAQPDWDDVLLELRAKRKRRRVRATRRTLWEEYRDEAQAQGGKAYSYSQFCARLKAHRGSCGGSAQMHFDYEPGLYGMADFSGKTLALRTGRGETDVEIFVAVLAHSNLIYAEAVPDQTVRHWTMAHRRALEYFGGSPRRWIIDNLKSGVADPDRDDIRLNPSYREFHDRNGWPLAMLGFSTAAWKLAPRDNFIGWTPQLREKNLPLVVDNPRFLILPWIEIPNLGSHILAIVRRRLPEDWAKRYSTTPVLIETFVETPRYTGAVYRASGWIRVGTTQGRGRYDRDKLYDKPRKHVWLRPLRRDWKRTLNR